MRECWLLGESEFREFREFREGATGLRTAKYTRVHGDTTTSSVPGDVVRLCKRAAPNRDDNVDTVLACKQRKSELSWYDKAVLLRLSVCLTTGVVILVGGAVVIVIEKTTTERAIH